jgi:hypothetical protein
LASTLTTTARGATPATALLLLLLHLAATLLPEKLLLLVPSMTAPRIAMLLCLASLLAQLLRVLDATPLEPPAGTNSARGRASAQGGSQTRPHVCGATAAVVTLRRSRCWVLCPACPAATR